MNPKRRTRIGLCILIGAGVLRWNESPRWSSAKEDAPVPDLTVLQPLGSFAITTDPAVRVLRFDANGGMLSFLLSSGPALELVKMNGAGLIQNSFALASSGGSWVDHLCAGPDGRIAVQRSDGQMEIYSPDGVLMQTISTGRVQAACGFMDNHALFLNLKDNAIRAVEGPRTGSLFELPREHLWGASVLDLGNQTLAIVDLVDASIDFLDTQAGVWRSVQLSAPEIQQTQRPAPAADSVAPLLSSVALDESSGDIFAALGAYNVNQGPIILRFSRQGVLLGRFRCVLPPKSANFKTKTNKDGHLSISGIAIVDQKLLLISTAQKQVVYYATN
jgi:hypothetical protein